MQIFVEYHEIANDPIFFVAPPPDLNLYMPNDVLYPFIMIETSDLLKISSNLLIFIILILIYWFKLTLLILIMKKKKNFFCKSN